VYAGQQMKPAAWKSRLLTQCSCLFIALLIVVSNVCAVRSQTVDLICFPISGGGGSDPIVRIHVLKNNGDWQIVHYSSKGKSYDRASQYWISDQSTPDSISWTGLLVNRNGVKMIGTVIEKNGASVYRERVYNIHKAGTDVAENAASCVGRISWAKNEQPESNSDPPHLPVLTPPSSATAQQSQTAVGSAGWSNDLAAAKQRMVDCVKRFPTLQEGEENAVQVEVRSRVAACGKDYLALLEQGGQTSEQSASLAEMEVYQALGCRIANVDVEEFRHTPDGLRMVTCSEEHFVPSKAKWWLVVYSSGRVSLVAGPYDHIGQCADSDAAQAMAQQNPSCELSAFSPVVGQPGEPPR
jgi:hypothetical protein